MFSVTGSVALLDIGDPSQPSFDMDGFFDTGTWGDLGGNLWVARFQAPGEVGLSGRVENWFAARTFEQGRVSGGAQSALTRQPFYAMTSNAYESTSKTLRTFEGSGNREQLTVNSASCGQNNLMACCQSGCAVSATVSQNFGGACGWSSTFACDASGTMTHAAVSDTPESCDTGTACAGASPYQAAASVNISTCASPAVAASGALACDSAGTCSGPTSTPAFTQLGPGTLSVTGTVPATRFFGVWAYGKDVSKTFSTLAEAATFDANRFTDNTAFTGTCAGGSCKLIDTTATTVSYNPTSNAVTAITGNKATSADPGWFYSYQGSGEKTGSGSTVVLGCAAWNGFMSTATGANTCSGTSGSNTSVAYLADYVSGVPSTTCGYGDGVGTIKRSTSQLTTAPPTTATVRVVVNAKGQVEYSALQLNPGAGPAVKAVGTRTQISEPVYWMEVPRDLHSCRHLSLADALLNCK
jgi:type IV pilus assembly protein PilY1